MPQARMLRDQAVLTLATVAVTAGTAVKVDILVAVALVAILVPVVLAQASLRPAIQGPAEMVPVVPVVVAPVTSLALAAV